MNTQSSRLQQTFSKLKSDNKKALIPFITTGDPQGTPTVDIMHALVEGGANVVELGMPFSDPAADGETIQHAGERAIAAGVGYKDSLAAVQQFRRRDNDTPVVLMGYLNPAEVHANGFADFAQAVYDSGADAVILVDLSFESGAEYRKALRHSNVDLITLVAPTTSKTRLGKMLKSAGGFVYYVSMRGVTGNAGASGLDSTEIAAAVAAIRDKSDLPVCVGFGINDGETAKAIGEFADGVVVGSALVKKLYNEAQNQGEVADCARQFMADLRQALDN